jgi:hypothetical protein
VCGNAFHVVERVDRQLAVEDQLAGTGVAVAQVIHLEAAHGHANAERRVEAAFNGDDLVATGQNGKPGDAIIAAPGDVKLVRFALLPQPAAKRTFGRFIALRDADQPALHRPVQKPAKCLQFAV